MRGTITTFDPLSGDTLAGPLPVVDIADDIAEHERAYSAIAERQTIRGREEAILVLPRIGFHWREEG